MTRACGSCGACCTVLEVEALRKPARVECRHLAVLNGAASDERGRCTVYARRPEACASFRCFWLREADVAEAQAAASRLRPALLLEDGERPDRVGLMAQAAELGDSAARRLAAIAGAAGGTALIVHEVWGGAAHSGAGERLLARLARRYLLVVRSAEGGVATVGPRALVERVAAQRRQDDRRRDP